MNWKDYITTDPAVAQGQACIKGTRILVSTVLDNLAEGLSVDEVIKEYPPITADDIKAAMAYAAELTRERTVILP
jgi:uncharacterized protein (DUF433 family)